VKNKLVLRKFKRLFIVQTGLALVIAALSYWLGGTKAAYSAGLGGLVCIVPNMVFAFQLFRHHGARAAKKIVNSFYKGEAIKIIISIVLFAIVFIMFDITPLAFFITYIVVQMSFWTAPWMITNN